MSKRINLSDCTITDYDKTGYFGEVQVEHEVEYEIAGEYGCVTVEVEVDLDDEISISDLLEAIDVEFEVDLADTLEEAVRDAVKAAEGRNTQTAKCEALKQAASEVLFKVARVVMEMYLAAAQESIDNARAKAEAEASAEASAEE